MIRFLIVLRIVGEPDSTPMLIRWQPACLMTASTSSSRVSTLVSQLHTKLIEGLLEEYAVPWEIEFREELPKSFVGKVLRRMLVEE